MTQTYVRMPATAGAIEFAPAPTPPATGGLVLTRPGGGYHFDPYVAPVPPPPPPAGFFLPVPAGWKVAVQHDFTKLSALPSDVWSYGGRPGGTTGCLWESSQISFDPVLGLIFTTAWSTSLASWITGAFGSTESYPAPWRFRVYDAFLDTAIDGLNHLMLGWNAGSGWIMEEDILEFAIHGGLALPPISRIHDGSSGDVVPPITSPLPELVNVWHCHEGFVDDRSGTPTYSILRDGAPVGSRTIPADKWAELVATPHWMGVQTELYSIGTAPLTAVSRRAIRGAEILVPA